MSAAYPVGTFVPSRFDRGLVAASYFASLCGCLLTIEILHRRGTSIKSLRSWLESFTCATSMGLVGVWCMHFIGNRAIILGDIKANVEQLSYGVGFTTLSVLLPVMGLTVAFSTAELTSSSTTIRWISLVCAGTFAGLSVVGMHYVGNLGVRNYHLIYSKMYILASVLIAVGDCLAVLVLFYQLREQWINLWWRRFMCAVLLAGGVSSMHFVGSTNCRYVYVRSAGPNANGSRNVQVIVAGALCGATALVILIGLILIRRHDRHTQRRSQKVMLSCAMFCPEGRVLVTPEGILPAREITDKFNHRTFDEEFDTAHPVFQWIFRVSRNWAGVMDLIPKMKSHLGAQRNGGVDDSRLTSSQSSAIYDTETYHDYEVIFREMFCVAAASIAASIHMPMDKLGVIYDKIIETGTLTCEEKTSRRFRTRRRSLVDVEAALRQSVFGKGQLMLLTRMLTTDEVHKLENGGFKFAFVDHVGRSIAHAMQIPQRTLEAHFIRLRRYADDARREEKSGTWLSCFAMIPKPNGKGFDVAVKKDSPDQLPDVALLPGQPTPEQAATLDQLDGLRVSQIAAKFDDPNGMYGSHLDNEARRFVDTFHQSMLSLMLALPKEWTSEARFWSKRLTPHYCRSPTTLYAFTVMGNMHTHLPHDSDLSRVPRTFFETRHRCYPGSPDHALLAKEIHAMFAPIFARKIAKSRPVNRLHKLSNAIGGRISPIAKLSTSGRTSSSSEESMVEREEGEHVDHARAAEKKYENNNLGGILVDTKTMVKTDSKVTTPFDSSEPTKHLGSIVAVGVVKPERTFADELVGITRARFMPASTRSTSY